MKKVLYFMWMVVFVIIFAMPVSSEAATGKRKNKSPISPWIVREKGVFVYQFNVFNLSSIVSMDDLKSIFKANQNDINTTYKQEYGFAINYKIYPGDQISNPELFNGDRLPVYIIDKADFNGFHSVQATEPANSESFIFGAAQANQNIQTSLGIEVPSNFPDWTPYLAISPLRATIRSEINKELGNNYGLTDPLQMLSFIISHELKETLFNDSVINSIQFDTFAPTVANWRYAKFNANGKCINGRKGKDGFVHLPLFQDVFGYGLLAVPTENGDVVSRTLSSKLNSYVVDDWRMTNYPVSTYWKGYYVANSIKWDENGLVELPLQPFAGLHASVLFTDNNDGKTSFGTVVNWGPITYQQRGDFKANNFPPDYTIISFDGTFPLAL